MKNITLKHRGSNGISQTDTAGYQNMLAAGLIYSKENRRGQYVVVEEVKAEATPKQVDVPKTVVDAMRGNDPQTTTQPEPFEADEDE